MHLWRHPLLQDIEQPRNEASEAVTELDTCIRIYQNEFIIIISFGGFIIPAAFPAFTLQVMSTEGALCVPVFHCRGCRVAVRLQKKNGEDRLSFPSS